MSYEWGGELPTLEAERVRLRGLQSGDVHDLFTIFGDAETMRYWSSPPLDDVMSARALLWDIREGFAARELFQWGIARRADDRVIGTCTLCRIETAHARAEIGFALARAEWGRGLARQALTRLIDFAFGDLALSRLEADVDPRNARSLATLERLGFRREGLLRERWRVGGETQDSVMLGLLAREWVAVSRRADAGESESAQE